MAANAILKTIKSDISWTKCDQNANEATFPTKFVIPDPIERFLMCSETILTFKSKITFVNCGHLKNFLRLPDLKNW